MPGSKAPDFDAYGLIHKIGQTILIPDNSLLGEKNNEKSTP